MSNDDRDKAGGHPVRHPRLLDCGCCEALTVHDRCGPRSLQRTQAIAERLDELNDDQSATFDDHAFIAGRCIRCDVDSIDASIYDQLRTCPSKADDAPLFYSTATGQPPVSTHSLA